ncbi:unnamed protein product [Prorocentrum cordatum]|uniref:Uncharacterized protein n=1 Tax=Prorocentrum cordatum TaxID=2364126 RepID=A0ABN9WQI5_9DINO|nr:unnamed protein product [Polarella glacialis]
MTSISTSVGDITREVPSSQRRRIGDDSGESGGNALEEGTELKSLVHALQAVEAHSPQCAGRPRQRQTTANLTKQASPKIKRHLGRVRGSLDRREEEEEEEAR